MTSVVNGGTKKIVLTPRGLDSRFDFLPCDRSALISRYFESDLDFDRWSRLKPETFRMGI